MRYTSRWGWIDDSKGEPRPTNAERLRDRHAKTLAKVKENTKNTHGSGRHSAH